MEWRSTYAFNPDGGGETSVTDSLGHTRVWSWNDNSLPLKYTDATGRSWQLAWNEQNQPEHCILPGGGKYLYGYDGSGKLDRISDPEGGTVSYVWNGRYPLLLSSTDAEGGVTEYAYDDKGNRVLVRHPNGAEEGFAYDDRGRLIALTTPLEGVHRFEWDNAGRLVSRQDCSGNVTAFRYDAGLGLLASVIDPLGHVRSLERDALGLPLAVIHPDGSTERLARDKAGRITSATDALGAVTRYRYNRRDQLVVEQDALDGSTFMRYDTAGNLIELTNPNGEQYRFAHDAEGRRLSYTGLDGVGNLYELDAAGLPARILLAVGTELETGLAYERDKLGRVLRRSGNSGVTEYRYSPGGRLVQVTKTDAQGEKESEISRSYDVMGNLTEEKSVALLPDGSLAERVLRHAYDPAGNRIRSVLPGGEIAEFTPCSSGFVHQITFAPSPDGPERVISAFERDALNRETLRTQGRLHAKRGYDPLSRVLFMKAETFIDEKPEYYQDFPLETGPLVSKRFRYDANGELLTSGDIFGGARHYVYDALGRVTAARRERSGSAARLGRGEGISLTERSAVEHLFDEELFLYDRAGNLLSTGTGSDRRLGEGIWKKRPGPARQVGELSVLHNRPDSIDDFTYAHDARGRVVEKRCLESERRRVYAYDSDGRLIRVECSGDPSGFKRIRFSYDALGRRTGRFDGRAQTLFVWDGLRLLREETGDKSTTYFYEQGGHVPLARVDGRNAFVGTEGKADRIGPEEIYYYHCNVAGLPEDVTDSEGRVIWRGRYSTWGRLLYERTFSDTPKGFTQPLRMQGQYDDGNTGLYYNTFRYYDADAGRFSAEDPIELSGGINLYNYASNPFIWADPLGLDVYLARTDAAKGLHEKVGVRNSTTGADFGISFGTTVDYDPENISYRIQLLWH
jgi:RHS repeat-associated protein